MDLFPNEQNFDLDKSRQSFHHSLKEHRKISNIPKFRCEMLYLFSENGINFPCVIQNDWKMANFAGLYYPHFTTFRNENFGILLILWCSFKLWWNDCLDLLSSKFCSLGNRSIQYQIDKLIGILNLHYINIHDYFWSLHIFSVNLNSTNTRSL
jgi:hypothetical protein